MENLAVNELRSRSRSKTPFLRSTCDGENCTEGDDHTHHKAGRKTPVKSRHTPVKQLGPPTVTETVETIREVTEEYSSPPAHRTRQSTKNTTDRLVKTSDYSSEESLDRLKGHRKEIFQAPEYLVDSGKGESEDIENKSISKRPKRIKHTLSNKRRQS